jgi:hypothetical protein
MTSTPVAPSGRQQSGFVRGSRVAAMGLARLFLIGIVVQFFLAGLALFEDVDYWEDHKSLGETLGIIPILLIIAAIVGRLPSRLIGMSIVLLGLWVVQYVLPDIDNGYIAALHPLNALLLMGLSDQIGGQIRNLTRSPA